MELLNTQRTEKLNRVKLVEKEKDELEGPKNEAMAYIKLENEVAQYKYSLKQVCLNFQDIFKKCESSIITLFLRF